MSHTPPANMSAARFAPLVVAALLGSLTVTSCAHAPRSLNDQDERFIAAGYLLECAPADVRLSTTPREPWKLRGEGCSRVVTFARMCRNPGPYETAYVQSMPPPPSVAQLERNYSMSRVFGNSGDQALSAWFMQSGRSREVKYGQGLADARMRDIERHPQPEYVPSEQVVMMPQWWMNTNCRLATFPTVFGKSAPPLPPAPSTDAPSTTPYDDVTVDDAGETTH
jgi:hypothetical protein